MDSTAVPSAASLLSSHCIEIAEDMGAEHDQITTVVDSAINVKTNGDILTLITGATTCNDGRRIRLSNSRHGSKWSSTKEQCSSKTIIEVEKKDAENHVADDESCTGTNHTYKKRKASKLAISRNISLLLGRVKTPFTTYIIHFVNVCNYYSSIKLIMLCK
ncbi:unnamed protein product [Vicia faba]|uniref:VAN3-binding protein-like auxin canalisation domain-containing protein n=1 Tax=Vicia faba TaxID=3906 RepID=A0AAV1A625_VICFA|nr:unnamed protein product [Vicia faba]